MIAALCRGLGVAMLTFVGVTLVELFGENKQVSDDVLGLMVLIGGFLVVMAPIAED